MSDTPGEDLEEEPQAVRGPEGSRDTGSDEPGGGPVDRPAGPAGGADEKTDTSVDPKDPIQEDMPNLPTGDQAG